VFEWLHGFIYRLAFALRRTVEEIEKISFVEFIGWIKYDRAECIGPERVEVMLAKIAETIALTTGNHCDIYDFLAFNPWNKMERGMPTDDQLIDQIIKNTGGKGLIING
jgi:hypothetical protein